MTLRFPRPLRPGDTVAITAPSSGVRSKGALRRLDLVLDHWRQRGFRVIEGECLRRQVSDQRAALPDLDIGHHQPQFTLIKGALAELRYAAGAGGLSQTWGQHA
jgi:muramoyltetrapeptide carboxypeptidase LdcA involved in peptidoglycan recycling